jgi:hypothetical protein
MIPSRETPALEGLSTTIRERNVTLVPRSKT